jgi:hypothetical protein
MTRKRTTIENSYPLHGQELHREDSVKYLGMNISSDITTIVNKAPCAGPSKPHSLPPTRQV